MILAILGFVIVGSIALFIVSPRRTGPIVLAGSSKLEYADFPRDGIFTLHPLIVPSVGGKPVNLDNFVVSKVHGHSAVSGGMPSGSLFLMMPIRPDEYEVNEDSDTISSVEEAPSFSVGDLAVVRITDKGSPNCRCFKLREIASISQDGEIETALRTVDGGGKDEQIHLIF